MDGERKVLKMESESVTGITDNDVCVCIIMCQLLMFFLLVYSPKYQQDIFSLSSLLLENA